MHTPVSEKYFWLESKFCPSFVCFQGGGLQWGTLCLLSIQCQPALVTVQNTAVNSKYITRVLKYESEVGTKSRHQTSSVKDYPMCHLGANIPIKPSSSVSPRVT